MFKTNLGTTDRVIRILLGGALLALWYFAPGLGWRWVPLALGIVALATGILSTCPLYSLLGLSTCTLKKA